MPKYFDIRRSFWAEEFGKALPYEEYLARSKEPHRTRWEHMAGKITLPEKHAERMHLILRLSPLLRERYND